MKASKSAFSTSTSYCLPVVGEVGGGACSTSSNNSNNNNNRHTIIHLTSSLNPIQTEQTTGYCAKLVAPTSCLTTNNKQSSSTTIGAVIDSQEDSVAGTQQSFKNHQNQPLYYSVFKLNESVDSPTTNMLIENGKLLYSPTTATSILVKPSFLTTTINNSISSEKPKINNSCNNNAAGNCTTTGPKERMNDSTCSESNLKIVQQRSTSNSSSDEDDTTALSGDSNYFDPCNEEDLESEETSDNSDEEEEDKEEDDEEEEDEDDDDYFDDGSEEEDEEDEEEDDEENSNRFWFGIEESCHVSRVLQLYCNFFELNAGRSANSRLPIQFIGKICRVIMDNDLFNIDDDTVRTYDIVDIYERTSNLQYGAVHRKLKTAYVETYYDNEGLPKKFKKRRPKDFPDEAEHQKSSWLYSFPIYGTSEEYHYESSLVDKSEEIGYADLLNRSLQKFNCKCKEIAGSPNDSQFMYTPCQQDDDDDDCDSDSDNSDCEGEDSSIPNYMKDLIPHLSGRGYLDTDICYGYFEDDK